MGIIKNLKGQTFHHLEVIEEAGRNKHRLVLWKCKCNLCGSFKEITGNDLQFGKYQSCGCNKKLNLKGKVFGHLQVLEEAPKKGRNTAWKCLCTLCGKETEIRTKNLQQGTKSCGCLVSKTNSTHKRSNSSEYTIWANMKTRCLNSKDQNYFRYGGRGIKVCDCWLNSFENFLEDMGERPSPKHSLDRIDVNGNYEPDNCRWATAQEQSNNTRRNRVIEFQGRSQNLIQWARELGINEETLRDRLECNWSVERALTEPLHNNHGRNKITVL